MLPSFLLLTAYLQPTEWLPSHIPLHAAQVGKAALEQMVLVQVGMGGCSYFHCLRVGYLGVFGGLHENATLYDGASNNVGS